MLKGITLAEFAVVHGKRDNMLTVGQKQELTEKLNQYNSGNCPLRFYRAFKILSGKSKLTQKEQEKILTNTYNKLKIM